MAVKVFVGGENFEELRSGGSYYVDKTELLYELVNNNSKVTLFTRPRRFGKTLTMRMIESFFDCSRDSRSVFEGLDIMKHEDFCAEWMNRYPVLLVTLKDVEGLTFESAYGMLKVTLSGMCIRYAYLADSDKTTEKDRIAFRHLMNCEASPGEIKSSFVTLCRMMHAHYGRPVILLIDEYDVPLAKANEEKEGGERYYQQMLEVIRGMMSTALKSNDHLKLGVVTGCLRIAKESIFTGVNNFASYSVLDRDYSTSFGFTEDEVGALLAAAGLEDRMETVRAWYDGYVIGRSKVFCPWDVICYVSEAMRHPDIKPKNYWQNTSGNGIIRSFVERTEFNVSGKFETLMNGGSITQSISDALTYDSLYESEENLWSVLLMTGYLTKADPEEQENPVSVRIPNREIGGIFQETVARFFSDHVDHTEIQALMAALWSGDEEGASRGLTGFLRKTISYMDYHETYYHAFLAGLFSGRGYEVYSNRESGTGRPDLILIDHRTYRVLILEAKRSGSKAQMEQDCRAALKQIAEREYAAAYEEDYDEILCYGVSFYRKSALVRKLGE